MFMLFVGCCCASLAGTLPPGVSASSYGQGDVVLGRTERLVPAGSTSQSISYSSRGNRVTERLHELFPPEASLPVLLSP